MKMFDSLYPEGVRGVIFSPGAYSKEGLTICSVKNGNEIKLKDEVGRSSLNPIEEKLLVRCILEAMLAEWASPKINQLNHGRMWISAVVAVREYLSDDKDLYHRVLAAAVVYGGGCAKHPAGLAFAMVPGRFEEIRDNNYLDGCATDKALQLVIDRLLEAGFAEEEIRGLWSEMLKMRYREGFLTACIYSWWRGLKIGEHYLNNGNGKVEETLKNCFIREFRRILLSGGTDTLVPNKMNLVITYERELEMLESLASSCWSWCGTSEGGNMFEQALVGCLARGQAAKASDLLARLGRYFHLCSFEVTLVDRKKFEDSLNRMVCGAIELASKNQNFGTACALAEYLGDVDQADNLRAQARHLGQRIVLDFVFYTRAQEH